MHRADGSATTIVGVVVRVWTNEATGEQHAEVAAWGRRWSGLAVLLRPIEPIDLSRDAQIAAGVPWP